MLFAGWSKLFDLRAFLNAVERLDLLPSWMVLPATILIVQSEIWLGLALAIGFRTKIIAALLAALVSLFIIVIVLALIRGTTGDCGCFGSIVSEQLGFGVIIRDTLILIGCLWLSFQRELNVTPHQKAEKSKTVDYS